MISVFSDRLILYLLVRDDFRAQLAIKPDLFGFLKHLHDKIKACLIVVFILMYLSGGGAVGVLNM